MMATFYSFVTLILCLLTGGGNELLDYLPTEAYWNEKKVEVSVEAMAGELADKPGEDVTALIAELGSPDAATRDAAVLKIREVGGVAALPALTEAAESPDAEIRKRARGLLRQIGGDRIERGVRRLMAIRTLGEVGKPEGLAALKPLLESKELFEAEYARAAIDSIEGRGAGEAVVRGAAAAIADDVWLLPKGCSTVGQLVPAGGAPLGYAEFIAAVKADDEDRRNADAETVTKWVLSLAEQIGNVRVDAVTFGMAGNPLDFDAATSQPPYVAVIIRGRYNSRWARTYAKSEGVVARDVPGL
jgi:HEAT repeat protein